MNTQTEQNPSPSDSGKGAGWTENFLLRHSDVDLHGCASILSLSKLFQEAAGKHADALGLGAHSLRERGLTWVLGKFQIKLHAQAAWKDRVAVHTWRAGFQRNFALRDYRAITESGELLAEATSYWAMFDMNARRAVLIPDEVRATYPAECERVNLPVAGRIAWQSENPADGGRSYDVRLSEIDENRHVTNTAYSSWALDSVDTDFAMRHLCNELNLVFKAEAFVGERIHADYQFTQPEHNEMVHRIRRESGEELALCVSSWVKRS